MVTGLATETLQQNRFLLLLRQSISAHGIFFAIILAYYAAYLVLFRLHPDLVPTNIFIGLLTVAGLSIPLMLVSLILLRFYHIVRYVKPERPYAALCKDLGDFLTNPQRMAHGLPMFFIMVLFGYIFMDIKAAIPALNPYVWDSSLANLDRIIHFGYQPWQLLQPIIGYAPVTFLINFNYNLWFFIMWMVWIFFGFSTHTSELRTRFFLSFFAVWIIGGSLMAISVSSAGPCYFSRLGLTPNPYLGLLNYLHSVNEVIPVWSVQLQDAMWEGYLSNAGVREISAMPSMHNGSALLFALAGYQVSKFWGRALAAQAVGVFIGSIHLAWHYAVDSYVAWLLALAVWFAMAPVARWWHATDVQKDFNNMLEMSA